MKDIKCPKCNTLISFKNIIMFDEKKMELIGIGYAMRCLKCNTVFIPEMRTSKKATKKQMEAIGKTLSTQSLKKSQQDNKPIRQGFCGTG